MRIREAKREFMEVFIMTKNYANEKRWVLFGCNVFFFIAVFLPFFEVELIITSVSMSAWNVLSGGFRVLMTFVSAGVGTAAGLCALMLLAVPVVHCLKLLGVFGARVRDSAGFSLILSFAELLAMICLPLTYLFADLDDAEMSDILNAMSVVFYVWLVVAIVAIVLSVMLEPAPVIVAYPYTYSGVEVCKTCGAQIASGSEFCWNCGTRVVRVSAATGVYCQHCGTYNSGEAQFCTGCGQRMPRADQGSDAATADSETAGCETVEQ